MQQEKRQFLPGSSGLVEQLDKKVIVCWSISDGFIECIDCLFISGILHRWPNSGRYASYVWSVYEYCSSGCFWAPSNIRLLLCLYSLIISLFCHNAGKYRDCSIGTFIIRGDSISLMGECDDSRSGLEKLEDSEISGVENKISFSENEWRVYEIVITYIYNVFY